MTASAAGVGLGQDFVLGVTDANAPPVLSGPAAPVVQQGQASAIAGVSVGEANALPAGQSVTVTLSDATGLLAVVANGATVTGSGTTSVSLTGTTTQVDAALATLTDNDSVFGTDTITLNSTDTRGGYAAPLTIAVSVNAPPSITVGGAQILSQGITAAISGISIADPDAGSANETLTVTIADTVGLLSATGAGVSGSGTTSLTITGSLSDVNTDLATLTDTEGAPGTDTITLNANDGRGGVAPQQTVGLTISGTPAINAPAGASAPQNKVAPISGVSLAEVDTTGGEMFTVTLSDLTGLLSATGTGVGGSGTTSLTITGSLAQVNADLATLAVKEAFPTTDTITLNASDTNGGQAAAETIALTTDGPVIGIPKPKAIGLGIPTTINGVRMSLVGSPTKGETLTVVLKDGAGLLSATGTGVTGSGTNLLTITGTMGQVNSDLATLTDDNATAGRDGIKITAADSLGESAAPVTLPVTVNDPPAIAAPAQKTLTQGKATAIAGVSISETGSLAGVDFTVTLSDTNGLLSASGKGITGNGTTTLTITGALGQVNLALKRLKDTDSVLGSDTITIDATDSLGQSATPASIAVTVNAPALFPPSAPAFVAAMAGHAAPSGAALSLANAWDGRMGPMLAANAGHTALA
jgi:hypothetical protein